MASPIGTLIGNAFEYMYYINDLRIGGLKDLSKPTRSTPIKQAFGRVMILNLARG